MKRIFYAFLILILGIIIFIWYAGAFENVQLTEQQDGPYIIAGKAHKGSYQKISSVFAEVDELCEANSVDIKRSLGIYYDDPVHVVEEELRSFGAVILEGDNKQLVPKFVEWGLTVDTIPNANAILADLPARSMFSYMIYPMKVYPAMTKWLNDQSKTPTIAYEVYDMDNKQVRYVMQMAE